MLSVLYRFETVLSNDVAALEVFMYVLTSIGEKSEKNEFFELEENWKVFTMTKNNGLSFLNKVKAFQMLRKIQKAWIEFKKKLKDEKKVFFKI